MMVLASEIGQWMLYAAQQISILHKTGMKKLPQLPVTAFSYYVFI